MIPVQLCLLIIVNSVPLVPAGRGQHGHNHNHHHNDNQNSGYVCVPIGTCPGEGGIDPRIVTPNRPTCPPGQEPCNTGNQGLTECGVRRVSQISNTPGPTTYGSFPWQAYIENQTEFTGSGALLTRSHVLTAAHKVNLNQGTPQNIKVYLGVWNPSNKGSAQMRTGREIRIHENFNPSTLVNDIAIIVLDRPVQFNDVVIPTCLPNAQQNFVNSPNCVVSGWGQSKFGANDAATVQKQVFVPIVNFRSCRRSMSSLNVGSYLDTNGGELCAGGADDNDACTQDGGAPLVCPDENGRYQLAGLVIWGIGCGRNNVYGVYVNVAHYRTWIDQRLN